MSKCGNPDCSVSTGVHEGYTFGSGELDDHGFWSVPCRVCAAEHDARMAAGRRDQLIDEQVAYYVIEGHTTQAALEMVQRHHEWIYLLAWPYAHAARTSNTAGDN